MAHGKVSKAQSERYVVRFYNSEWEEVDELRIGRVSHMGALYAVADWLCGRLDLIENLQLPGLKYANMIYVSVEVDRG